jgi:hypothetical protein
MFFSKTDGKEHTIENCTVNTLCRALFIVTHGKALSCAEIDARQRISKSIKKLPCTEIDARQTLQKKLKNKGQSLSVATICCSGHPIITEKIKKQRPEASPSSPPPTAPAIRRGKGWAGRAVPPRSACCRAP